MEHSPLLHNDKTNSGNMKRVPAPIGVIGTGNYGVALSKRLNFAGHRVVMGSRYPERRETIRSQIQDCTCGIELAPLDECFRRCNIIFVAIHMENFKITLKNYSELARNKIIVDITNREFRYAKLSNSDILASILPEARIVKAFNSISAHVMDQLPEMFSGHKVFVAGDDADAKHQVYTLAHSMGFSAVDFGGLKSAKFLEEFVLKVFTHWNIPIFVCVATFVLWSIYIVFIYFIEDSVYKFPQIFLKVLNKPLCMTAITMIAFTYLPGQIAAIIQVCRGTKHERFPRFLDTWLKCRKQFGLLSFLLVCFHAFASAAMMSPTYYSSWFQPAMVTLPGNLTALDSDLHLKVSSTWMVWKGEAAILTGLCAFLVMGIIALTSLPSVANTLNWSEWQCIHTKMATLLLVLSIMHVLMMATPAWAVNEFVKTVRGITFLSLVLPCIVLLLKIFFTCPPLRGYLKKIRRGWERGSDKGHFKHNTSGCCKNDKKMSSLNDSDMTALHIVDIEEKGVSDYDALGAKLYLNSDDKSSCRCSTIRDLDPVRNDLPINNPCDCSSV